MGRALPIGFAMLIGLVALLHVAATSPFYDATPQYGLVGHAGVTGTTSGGANTIMTLTGRRRIVMCTNSLNTETIMTYNTANWTFLPAASSFAVDLSASGLTFGDGNVIGIYYVADPSSGSIACTAY